MPTLSHDKIASLIQPFLTSAQQTPALLTQLSAYLDLLMRWNGKTNLTAIRDPEEIVRRHFGESLFTAAQLTTRLPSASTLLDFGSGAGFPGVPIQLLLPDLAVTLAESQGKKAAFLRETVRVLKLPTAIWPRRVEDMPPSQLFDIVAMRAVDDMPVALAEAKKRLNPNGSLAILGGEALAFEFPTAEVLPLPESSHRFLILTK